MDTNYSSINIPLGFSPEKREKEIALQEVRIQPLTGIEIKELIGEGNFGKILFIFFKQ